MARSPSITLEALPVSYGDCLLVSCATDGEPWRMLVDTGPDETYATLRARLLQLPTNAQGRRTIDLFVVSHIDHDHIGAARLLLDDAELRLDFGDIWFNAPPTRRMRGVAEGVNLATLLGATTRGLPWNLAFGGGLVCTPALGGGVELTGPGAPTLTLLSPTPDRLDTLFKVWAQELQKLRLGTSDETDRAPAIRRGREPSLEEIAARPTALDRSVPNASSIAILLEHRGASVLLGADAFADVMVPALRALIERRKLKGPLTIDAYKLSHHGSKGNLTTELLALIDATHHIVSTNNTRFQHPDAEAMARVILGRRGTTLCFNHDTLQNRRWADPGLCALYGHRTAFPQQIGPGFLLHLP